MNINKIDPIYYINQLLTQLVFNITTKEAVTIFAINHSQNENPCVQTYLNYLTETYGIDESETDHIDDLLRSNDYDSLSKQSQKETKSSVLSSVNEFPNDIQSIIKSECSNEYIRKVSEEQSYRINNIQQAMIIMKKEVMAKYCEWLFDILFELEKRVDTSKYDSFHARFYGRVSELLLDVWIRTNKLSYKEVKLRSIEKTNWWKKGMSFLKAKFKKEKYGKSF